MIINTGEYLEKGFGHRSERFGFCLAEAMYFGKPVIATTYSENLDFMTPETACLAAEHMARLGDDPAAGRRLGARASAWIRRTCSPLALGLSYRDRLEAMARPS